MKILIVDDHAVIHHGLRRILDDEFPNVTFGDARDSQSALDLVQQERWDVVILDMGLPGRDGLETLKRMKSEQPNLPVIIFSVHPEEQFAVRALKAGASGYLAKETAPEQLVGAVRKVMRGGKYVSDALAEKLASELGREAPLEPHETLSDREFEILRLITAGMTPTQMAMHLSLSVKTISTYRTRILEKLQLKSVPELVRYALDHGLDR